MSVARARAPRAVPNSVRGLPPKLGGLKHSRSFSFMCDMPPTANHMHTVARGRKIKSATYRKWLTDAATMTAAHRSSAGCNPIKGAVEVVMTFPRINALSDLDNRIKPILDCLQCAGVVENDRQVYQINASWRPKTYQDQEKVWVTVTEIEP